MLYVKLSTEIILICFEQTYIRTRGNKFSQHRKNPIGVFLPCTWGCYEKRSSVYW